MKKHFNTKTIEQFIIDAKKVHGDRYDYSLVRYKNTDTNIKIICPDHGVFEQLPTHHINGSGCPECSGVKKYTTESYIEKVSHIHNNKYDYSLVKYKNNKTYIKITCPIHGVFEQSPKHHMNGVGCPKCGRLKSDQSKRKTTEDFIIKVNKIHNNKYDYSLTNYTFAINKVIIICPIHGIFEQTASNHLSGHGCKKCSDIKSRLRRIKEIEKDKFNGYQIIPSYNTKACILFDKISLKENIHIQHAMNGGEFYIKELGYWVDGYDSINNVVYEYDEKHHKYQKDKDLIRENEIINYFGCKFIRIKE